jgi:hypothetical protein
MAKNKKPRFPKACRLGGINKKDGSEKCDGKPLSIKSKVKPPETLREKMRYIVNEAISEDRANREFESLADAQDFDEDDPDSDIISGYEVEYELADELDYQESTLPAEPSNADHQNDQTSSKKGEQNAGLDSSPAEGQKNQSQD